MTQRHVPPQSPRFATTPLFAGLPGDVEVSFEFFPPRSEQAEAGLLKALAPLASLSPAFVSMTYGAGGSTRERSFAAIEHIMAAHPGLPVAAHLTCVAASRAETHDVADRLWDMGVRHVVALRGDAGAPGAPFAPHPQGYTCAAELVAGLKARHPFEISVSAYPELHPEAASAEAEMDYLKRKFDAGADRAITQFFFCSDTFFRFRDRAAAAGIAQPIVPGVLPVTNIARTVTLAEQCGAQVPLWLRELFAGLDGFGQARELVAATVTAEFCRRLYAEDVRRFHFYTLNRAELAYATCHLLGVRGPAIDMGAIAMEQAA
ncbi:MAG: methylenetetrahydrofolate reductase [Erythrobacter sp.]|nr:methylenetetrahydrofolate reductase [Erythrobacter sp.]